MEDPPRAHAEPAAWRLVTAEILSIGTELTTGETRDTNAGDLARSLTETGVTVGRIQALPDDLDALTATLARAVERADLIVTTGGLGPTPDDLTREAIARLLGEQPRVDAELETWLRGLWARRGLPFPALNLKQAWLIPSARAIPNDNGTAPGWWVDRADGRVIVALPGPPREMRPMWDGWAMPRLVRRGLGRESEVRTLRLFGIGESQVAEQLGDELLRAANPVVATYARNEAVDVRIAAVAEHGRSAAAIADETEATVLERLGEHVWARGATTWADAVGEALAARGWTLATVEIGTGGSLAALFGSLAELRRAEVRSLDGDGEIDAVAADVRAAAAADVGLAVRIDSGDEAVPDAHVSLALALPDGTVRERRVVFGSGVQGRHRAALTAADALLRRLREGPSTAARRRRGAARSR